MDQPDRLAVGGRIDRDRSLGFVFNGRRLQGYQGDTLASALLANGVGVVNRSIKYHRPRGIVGSGAEEPNAVLQIGMGAGTLPDQRATQVELYDGLEARSINGWPGLSLDAGAAIGLVSRFLPPGFFYKTFMRPKSLWPAYERVLRRAAGLGVSPKEPDPDRYDQMNAHCDVLVVGGGPAGLAAALEAGRTGARVILVDEQNEFGGSLLGSGEMIDGAPAMEWVAGVLDELASMEEVRLLARATAFGYYAHNFLGIVERVSDHTTGSPAGKPRERLWRVRARDVVLATGAIERPLVFPNNDRPGVMLASAVSTYINRYAVAPGSRAVVFANNDSGYRAALDMAGAGMEVSAVIDARPKPGGDLPQQVRARGITVLDGQVVVDVSGRKRVKSVNVMRLNASGDAIEGPVRKISCDLVAVSGGWSPTVHLHAQSGGRPRFDVEKGCFVPGLPVQAERSAGASAGIFSLSRCLETGLAAGAAAAQASGFGDGGTSARVPESSDPREYPLRPMWVVPSQSHFSHSHNSFVDLQPDVPTADIATAVQEGYDYSGLMSRYTALGFGTDQGRTGNVNGMGIFAQLVGEEIQTVGTATFRPPYTPVTFGAMAGRDITELFDPVRKTPIHEWHVQAGAPFEDVGQWKRPWYYPRPGESMQESVDRECLAARNGVAITDQSTLGKIDIQGPDAAEFLNRVYTNGWKSLGIGRCRYGLMLGEDGMVLDDGVTARLGEDHYLMHTTSGGAAMVMTWLERWLQTEWPELRVYLTSVTDHWANIGIVGPEGRRVITELCDDIDFSGGEFPFMSVREGTVAGVPARIFRISFSGELTYEVNVQANYGMAVWEAIWAAGQKHGITPYCTETLHHLRAEKGYIIVGQDTDGSVTPVDLGMESMLSKKKDYLGRRSLSRSDLVRPDREQLVGLLSENPAEVLPEGGQIVDDPSAPVPVPMIGHVTSSYYSANLGRSFALALVQGGRGRMGDKVHVSLKGGRNMAAVIASPVFYDPEGAHQNV